jgi:putative transcriptional regulator
MRFQSVQEPASEAGAAAHSMGFFVVQHALGTMAITRMTLEQIKKNPSKLDHAKIDATTEEDIRRHMIEDGEDPDEEVVYEEVILPSAVRKRLGMTQEQFARILRVPVGTLRNWEQNRVALDPSTRALFKILTKEPEAALRALNRD